MPVPDADPQALSLDEAFQAAMSGPAKPREAAPPEEVDTEAPFGRDANGKPIAKYGLTKDGRVRRSAGGRRPKDDRPRVAEVEKDTSVTGKVSGKKGPAATPEPRDYSEALADAANTAWLGLSVFGMVGSKIPVVGRYLPEDRIGAEAALFKAHSANLCGAINLAAQHSAKAAKVAAKLADGDVTWQASCMFMVLPFVLHTTAVIRGDDALTGMGLPKAGDLAEKNADDMKAFMEEMATKAAEAQQAVAEGLGEAA